MNIFGKKRAEEKLEGNWGRYGINDETVAAYVRKNDSVELNVPLQIIRGLVDELLDDMARSESENEISMAMKQGMLKAYYKTALRIREVTRDGRKLVKSGGLEVK